MILKGTEMGTPNTEPQDVVAIYQGYTYPLDIPSVFVPVRFEALEVKNRKRTGRSSEIQS